MATYLIDYENVYIEGLTGLERLSQRDEVVIFYTQNRCGLTFELHQRLISCKAKLRLMEVTALSTRKNTVKNALDLQLSMYIGYLVGSRPKEPLYIISKDTDFDLDLTFFDQYLQTGKASLAICTTIENALEGVPKTNAEQMLTETEEETADTTSAEEENVPEEEKQLCGDVPQGNAVRGSGAAGSGRQANCEPHLCDSGCLSGSADFEQPAVPALS